MSQPTTPTPSSRPVAGEEMTRCDAISDEGEDCLLDAGHGGPHQRRRCDGTCDTCECLFSSAPSDEGIQEDDDRLEAERRELAHGLQTLVNLQYKGRISRNHFNAIADALRGAQRRFDEIARLTREQATRTAALDALREARNGCRGWLTRRLQCGERAAGHVQLCRNCSTALDAAIATLLGGGDAITGMRNAVDHACAGCGDAEATRETDDGVELCDDCFVAVPVTQESDDA